MAIKTRPMPKLYCSYFAKNPEIEIDQGNINDWNCDNSTISGKVLIQKYKDRAYNISNRNIYVPKLNGTTMINTGYRFFYNQTSLTFIDFQKVPVRDNALRESFSNCKKLHTVRNINNSITNMYGCFMWCSSVTKFNGLKLPTNLIDMRETFYNCSSLNMSITIPNKVQSMYQTFMNCTSFNSPITIPNSVTNMYRCFNNCQKLNQPITIPNSVTNIKEIFSNCRNLNAPITIGTGINSTTNPSPFTNCWGFNSTVTIYSTELSTCSLNFPASANKTKTVKIYYQYNNGINTKTYSALKGQDGHNGVKLVNMGRAPW